MYLSKNVLAFFFLAGAGLFGWLSSSFLGQLDAPHSAALIAPAPGSGGDAAPPSGGSPPTGGDPADGGPLAMAETQAAPDGSNMNVTIVNSATDSRTSNATQISSPPKTSTAGRTTNAVSVRSATPTSSGIRIVAIPVPVGPVVAPGTAAAPAQPRVSINGNHIVIASDGSVVFVGDDGKLNANTGPTSASGTVAIDTAGSQVQSGSSGGTASSSYGTASGGTATGTYGGASGATAGSSSGGATAALSDSSDATGEGGATVTLITTSGGAVATHSNGSLDSVLSGTGSDGRSVAIAGFEDHSVSVIGDDHLITYDDSNVFVGRDGQINANTGDTDSSGLNVVDAVGSVVRSGNSGDGEGNDDEEEEDEAEDPVGLPTDSDPDDSVPDDGETDDESDIAGTMQMLSSSSAQPTTGGSAMVDDEDVTTSASGWNPFVIGADGYDDVSIRVNGNRDIVTYDDSNVVIGGTGGVNAQIGDSDTAGAVVMGVRDSYIQAGCEGDLCYSK